MRDPGTEVERFVDFQFCQKWFPERYLPDGKMWFFELPRIVSISRSGDEEGEIRYRLQPVSYPIKVAPTEERYMLVCDILRAAGFF